MIAPLLFFSCGNPARGDDALGPLLGEKLAGWVKEQGLAGQIEVLTDFQLSPEHAFDLTERQAVIFADAMLDLAQPCCWQIVQPSEPAVWASHASTPAALLWYCQTFLGLPPPPAYLLGLQSQRFELGEPLSQTGQNALEAGWQLLQLQLAELSLVSDRSKA